jgi:hypothetical protein
VIVENLAIGENFFQVKKADNAPQIKNFTHFPFLMIVRIYGFALNRKELPPDIPASAILQFLKENSNLSSNETLRWIVTTTKIEDPKSKNVADWFLGVLLKVRDSSRFTKVAVRDGKLNITSEVLRENESLIEANCFLLNPSKGTGIYSHYRGAGSLQYDFQKVFQKTLRKLQKILKKKFDDDVTKVAQKRLRQRLDGHVVVDTLLLSGDPKDVISRFKRINNASLKLTLCQSCSASCCRFQQCRSSCFGTGARPRTAARWNKSLRLVNRILPTP